MRQQFSADGRYWWTGEAWMPTRPPDGQSARWNGVGWTRGGMNVGAVIGIAALLALVEFVWAVIVVIALVVDANNRYGAAGRVGDESITNSPLAAPLLLSLLIIPAFTTIFSAVNLQRWWAAVLLGGWPAPLIAFAALISPGEGRFEAIVVMGAVLAALSAIAWLATRLSRRTWTLSADGATWESGHRSFPTLSVDGRWRWDGETWRLQTAPGSAQAEAGAG
jgi:hypothetical protein